MKLKSIFNKLSSGKKQNTPPDPHLEEKEVKNEISFERLQTQIEEPGTVAEIDVIVNDEKTNIHTLAPVTKIGRDPAESDIIIPELIVSKLHCSIIAQGDHFYVKDEQSTNGVFVNNERVTEQKLKNGDTILLGKKGSVKLVFHIRR